MPPRGAHPKPEGQAVTRNPKVIDWIDVPDVPFAGGPKLPATQPDGLPWPRGIARRWKVWSTMPHCVIWSESDWQFALDTLVIAARFDVSATTTDAAEMRNREKVMGTTMDYRRALRIRYIDPASLAPLKSVANLDDFRAL